MSTLNVVRVLPLAAYPAVSTAIKAKAQGWSRSPSQLVFPPQDPPPFMGSLLIKPCKGGKGREPAGFMAVSRHQLYQGYRHSPVFPRGHLHFA